MGHFLLGIHTKQTLANLAHLGECPRMDSEHRVWTDRNNGRSLWVSGDTTTLD